MINYFLNLKNNFLGIAFWVGVVLLAFGQPVYSTKLGVIAGNIGFALIWWSLWRGKSSSFAWFTWGTVAFAAVQAIQLSWMTSYEYQGYYILFVYLIFFLLLGLQFGFLCWILNRVQSNYVLTLCLIPAIWTLLEWSRLYWFSGFTWNPVGMAFLGNRYLQQSFSLFGVYGLSFLIVFLNCVWFHLFQKWNWRRMLTLVLILGSMVFYGHGRISEYERMYQQQLPLEKKALLLTSYEPPFAVFEFKTVWDYAEYSLGKWLRTLPLIRNQNKEQLALIVFPEAYFPFPADFTMYPLEEVEELFQIYLGADIESVRPDLVSSYAKEYKVQGGSKWMVSNGFCLQLLANHLDADIVIGLEHSEKGPNEKLYYNAMLHFAPGGSVPEWYAKRRLIPVAEYFPFSWMKSIAHIYGIEDAFSSGNTPGVFNTKIGKMAPSICYEETYSGIMRENALLGANFLVNVTNDIWFPRSRLAEYHFYLGLVRSIETGLPSFRSCNMGVSAVTNAIGLPIAALGDGRGSASGEIKLLEEYIDTVQLPTLYMVIGEQGVIAFCFFLLGIGGALHFFWFILPIGLEISD